MPSCTGVLRLLRRRLVLGLIFALSLTYCAFSLFRNEKNTVSYENDLDDMDVMIINDNDELIADDDPLAEQFKASAKPSLWQMEVLNEAANNEASNVVAVPDLNDTESTIQACRNSIQGKILIVDERGIVCARHEVLPNGCCSTEQKTTQKPDGDIPAIKEVKERYSCKTCNPQGCCAVYEYCVSCCLHPAKRIKGKKKNLEGDSTRREAQKMRKNEDITKLRLRNLDRFQACLAVCRTSSASVRHENTYKDPHSKHCYTLQTPYSHQRHRRDLNSLNNNGDNRAVVITSSSAVQSITFLQPSCHLPENHYLTPREATVICTELFVVTNYYSHVRPP